MHLTTLLYFLLGHLAAAAPTSSPSYYPTNVSRDAPGELPRIVSVSYSGSGCPSSSPAVDRTTGSGAVEAFRLNGFKAETTPSASTSSVNCQVHLQLTGASAGWQVGVGDVVVRGRLVLDPGARLEYYVTSFWSEDAGETVTIRGTVPNDGLGRLDSAVTTRATVPPADVVYSPCTAGPDGAVGLLNVNFRVALLADGNQYGYFGKDAASAVAATESWGYVWRRC
ncbi:hypothetical protein F4779DRAFT_641533 [Xylariaceae sp. FL0662B]|nr:hypothetical protein F4779DRAFT_641533 [Xylariaceae sp. FL0662B]